MPNINQTGCGCAPSNPEPINMQFAMAYVKRQRWADVYPADTALCVGTIFPELEFPFMGKGGCSR